MCLCILLQWRTIRSPCRRTATVRFLAIVRVLLISRGSWRVLYYYRIFSITTRRNPLLLRVALERYCTDRRRRSSHRRSQERCIVLTRTVSTDPYSTVTTPPTAPSDSAPGASSRGTFSDTTKPPTTIDCPVSQSPHTANAGALFPDKPTVQA